MNHSLDDIVRRNGRRFPQKPALVMAGRSLSWKSLDQRIDQVANAMQKMGLKSGDRVAILLPNCLEYFELYFGLARAGLISVPVNYRLTPREMAQVIGSATPGLFVVGDQFAEAASQLEPLLPELTDRWLVGDAVLSNALAYEEVLAAAGDISPLRALTRAATETFAIFFTSGTTGLPKGAMVSHLNLEANGYNQIIADGSVADDVNLVATPLYHMGAVFMSVTYMMLGCTQVVLEKFDPPAWLKHVEEESATVSLLVPTMINSVLNAPELKDTDLDSLRLIFYGGGPMPQAVLECALQKLPCGFTQGYGLTETLEATFLVAKDHVPDGTDAQQRRLNSAGREAVGAEISIVGTDGDVLPVDEVGEILVRSRSVISGYWQNSQETEKTIRNGWFHTGDLGYLDDQRYLFVVDRLKDMVVSGGVNIYTKEVEDILYEHPEVLEAAVYGLPDEKWGEQVTAAVVLRPKAKVSAEGLAEHCNKYLAGYKRPRAFYFLENLPKNPSGKILKRDLRTLQGHQS
jgi:long-chain acyl-CoA synthetase